VGRVLGTSIGTLSAHSLTGNVGIREIRLTDGHRSGTLGFAEAPWERSSAPSRRRGPRAARSRRFGWWPHGSSELLRRSRHDWRRQVGLKWGEGPARQPWRRHGPG